MHGKFGCMVTLLSVLLMAAVICVGFASFNGKKDAKAQATMIKIEYYSFKAMATIKGFVSPILNQVGIDSLDPRDTVKQTFKQAASTLEETTRGLTH